jgi:S1-C subfamily serine protease
MARAVMDQLMKGGKVRRGMIGVTIQAVNADLAASLNLPSARGAIVSSVQAGGPAERAGVKRGDVIVAFNGQPVADSNNLRNLVASTNPGTKAALTVLRDGREQTLNVTLGELPTDSHPPGDQPNDEQSSNGGGKFGLTLQPLTADLAGRLGVDTNAHGLVVTQVDPSGIAAEAGIRQGDVIEEVNRQAVQSPGDFNVALQRSGSRPALLLVNRRGSVIYMTLKPGS